MECMDVAEFEKNLDDILLSRTSPIAVTRNGEAIGHYLPVWHMKTGTTDERTQVVEPDTLLQESLAALGLTEEELLKDFKKWRASQRQK